MSRHKKKNLFLIEKKLLVIHFFKKKKKCSPESFDRTNQLFTVPVRKFSRVNLRRSRQSSTVRTVTLDSLSLRPPLWSSFVHLVRL